MDPPLTTFLSRNTCYTHTVAPKREVKRGRKSSVELRRRTRTERGPRVESCGRIKVMGRVPALVLETVAAVGQDLKSLSIVGIAKLQKDDPLLYKQLSGRAGWK